MTPERHSTITALRSFLTRKGTLLKYIFTFLALVLICFHINVVRAVKLISEADLRYLILFAFVLSPLFFLLKLLKWRMLVRMVSRENGIRVIASGYFLGFTLGIFTPGRIGEFSRIAGLSGDRAELASMVFFDRLLDFLVVLLLALSSLFFLFQDARPLILGSMILIILGYFRFPSLILRLSRFIKGRRGLREMLQSLIGAYSHLRNSVLLNLLGMTLGAYLIIITQFITVTCSFAAFDLKLVLMTPVVMLNNIVPITVGGYGLREWLFLVLNLGSPLPREIIVNVSLLWFTINTLMGMTGNLIPGILSSVRRGLTH